MDKKKETMETNVHSNSRQKSPMRPITIVLIVFLVVGLSFWGANYISKSKMQAAAEIDTRAAETYELYSDKFDAIMATVSDHPDHLENMNVIKLLLELQQLVANDKESFKTSDGSYSDYDELQAKIVKNLDVHKAKVVLDDESFYNYAALNLETADSYSVEKCLGVMKELMENLEADAKVTNVFPTPETQEEFTRKAQERYDAYAKKHEEMKAEAK